MSNGRYRKYWLTALACVCAACVYPLYMGGTVIVEMARNGAVPLESYPKYIIPYTPIAVALIFSVLALPLIQKHARKLDLLYGGGFAVAVFFAVERIFETKILVKTQELISLESWQMSLCYVPPEQYEGRTWEAVDVLLGGYSPAFKLHFYLISVVIILTLLNCLYGFGKMVRTGDRSRKRALTVQAAASLAFLGMCVWACFTAFYRTGDMTVSFLSALLMSVFFSLIGVTVGTFACSFVLGRAKRLSVAFPAALSAIVTLLMYIGEMILLSGNLYRFGDGVFFRGLGILALAPVDCLVIIASGAFTACVCLALNRD